MVPEFHPNICFRGAWLTWSVSNTKSGRSCCNQQLNLIGDASTLAQLQLILATAFTVDVFISILDLFWKRGLWSQIFQLLLKKIWSLPTLVKATALVFSWIVGAGEARTAIMLTKSVVVLALLYREKPEQ